MRVLCTGAAGFVGSHAVRALLEAGHQVTAVVRDPARAARLADLAARVDLRVVDLDDAAATDALLPAETILHAAWYTRPKDYLGSRENLRSLATTLRFAERAFESGCKKLVVVGSCLEYADLPRLRLEDDALVPSTLYASCKVAAYHVLGALAKAHGAELVWGRMFHVHGRGEAAGRLLPWLSGRLRAGEVVELGDGLQLRDHLHVADVATGLVTLLTPGISGAFNICTGQPVTLREVVETVASLLGRPDLLRFVSRPRGPNELAFLAGDPTRLRALGWRPRFDLRSGLADALELSLTA